MSAAAIHQKFIHLADVAPRPSLLTKWEKQRHTRAHWFVEMVAEATGVFFFVFGGVGANLIWIIGTLGEKEGVGSLFTVGVGYALGIVFAISVCGSTSGGHFSPAVTLTMVLFKGFPPLKALRYIFAQILGGYIAFMLIYVQYYDLIATVTTALKAAGPGIYEAVMFTPQGPAGAFALYVAEGSSLGRVFLNEFIGDFFLGLVIFSAIDPTNYYIPPFLAPIVIAAAYAAVIWGYAPVGIAANAARDVSGRLAAVTIWGTAASGGNYAALAALTNIPATLFAAIFYEFFFTDSSRVIDPAHRQFMEGHQAHMEHRENLHENTTSDSDARSTDKEDLPHHNRV